MRKLLTLILSVVLVIGMITGCGKKDEKAGSAKTGLGVVTSIADSKDAGEEDGLAQMYSTIAAVIVDEDGVIQNCVIDAAQTKVNFSATGELTTDLATEFSTKQEIGEGYGMKKASLIGKEWNEQADAFAEYVVGKTLDEVKGIALNEEGVPSETDLTSSVTVHVGDFISAIEKAVTNAKDLGASSADKLGLGVLTNIAKSKNAGEEDGLAQAYSNYAVATFDGDGKITSSTIDASQSDVKFSNEGKVTSDLTAELKTKNELGSAYGMASASSIGKEWNEQAEAFAKYVVGKKLDDVKGIAVNEEGVPSDADLASSVTVHIGDFISVLEKANTSAK